jgi:polar amino acid transport system substrate-binding protein
MRMPQVLQRLLLVAAFSGLLLPRAAFALTLTFGASDVDRVVGRVTIEVVTQAYAQLGIDVRFERYPTKRRILAAEQGELDGLSATFDPSIYNPQGKESKLIQLPTSIGSEDFVVFTKLKKIAVNGYASLNPFVIGYVDGVRINEQRFKDMHTDVAPNQESLFRKLEAGRTDVAVDTRSGICTARRLKLMDIVTLEPALETQNFYHYVHKRHRDLVPKLETVLQKMKQDGSIKKIQERVELEFYAQCKCTLDARRNCVS